MIFQPLKHYFPFSISKSFFSWLSECFLLSFLVNISDFLFISYCFSRVVLSKFRYFTFLCLFWIVLFIFYTLCTLKKEIFSDSFFLNFFPSVFPVSFSFFFFFKLTYCFFSRNLNYLSFKRYLSALLFHLEKKFTKLKRLKEKNYKNKKK